MGAPEVPMPASVLDRLGRVSSLAAQALAERVRVLRQFMQLRQADNRRFAMTWADRWLCFGDATRTTDFDRHYVFHVAWACRILAETRPAEHVDISSSLYFVTTASAFVPIRFYDYRPADVAMPGLVPAQGDLTKLAFPDRSIDSLSCMHVIEHVGLGRYGDPLDEEGDLKAARELSRVLAPGGRLLVAMPIGGKARIQFNAHRVYTYALVLQMFADLELAEFSLIPEEGPGLVRDASEELAGRQRYGCGCFVFQRPAQ